MSHLDQTLLNELRELMEDDFSVLLDAYLTEAPTQRQAIEDAYAGGDAETLRRCAHSLKGSSSNIGAAGLAGYCQKLEDQAHSGDSDVLAAVLGELQREYDAVYREIGTLS